MQQQELQGIVLCAGLGTRLRPLTTVIPKPAVPVGPVPAALRNIEQMLDSGISLVHCNTHYLAHELENELQAACRSRSISPDKIRFWNETDLLETGGGIARIVHALASEKGCSEIPDTMVVSGDIVADIPVLEMREIWKRRQPSCSALMVSLPLDKPRKDVTWVDLENGRVRGFGMDFEESAAKARGLSARVFSNHQILSGTILERQGIEKKSSIDLFYRSALRQGEEIVHLPWSPTAHWFDIGTPASYLRCAGLLRQPITPHIDKQSISKISLCLPAYADIESDKASDTGMIRHARSRSRLNSFAQFCLSKTTQDSQWCWLGELHALPAQLVAALERICHSALSDDVSGKGLDASTLGDYFFQTLADLPLQRPAASSNAPDGFSGLESCEGFLTAKLPSNHSAFKRQHTPLLVSLDLLLGAGSQLSHHSLSQDSLSPFWVLFIPQKLSTV
jgi:mannose-1-phosphate guanylyltransferase